MEQPHLRDWEFKHAGNLLHDEYAKRSTDDRQQRIAIISSTLDLIWSNFFEWIIFSELDGNVLDLIAKGEPPSGGRISQMYLDLLRQYYGSEERLAIDDNFSAEWMVESVPFASYEHQFWPPAMGQHVYSLKNYRPAKWARATQWTKHWGLAIWI